MKAYVSEPTKETPLVCLDPDNQRFEVSGRSFPLNAKAFYAPVLEWLDGYAARPVSKTVFRFQLEYFNTPSSKSLSDIMKRLRVMKDNGHDVVIEWYYEEDDVDILDLGHVFSRTVGMAFDFKEID